MSKEYIICVDDELAVVQSLKQELKLDSSFKDISIEISDSPLSVPDLVNDIIEEGGEILVVITDQRMPRMKGDELLLTLHDIIPETLKILLTGFTDLDAVVPLVNRNALYRYLSKPWDQQDMILTIRDACLAYRQKKTISELNKKIMSMTYAMVMALENTNLFFDQETGNHVHRISLLSSFIARKAALDDSFTSLVSLYSPLHDIGKIGVRKDILLKAGKLTPIEFEHIKEHVTIGFHILDNQAIDVIAKNIVLYHHEKWNGAGYRIGLKGEQIPLEARIVSIADVFDALISERVYKKAYPVQESLAIMKSERAVSFDPALLDPFLDGLHDLASIDEVNKVLEQ